MLELRPTCENCNIKLPADSLLAMICTYECTFCEDCVNNILNNVCPNCGGGFMQRPVRPKNNLKNNNYLSNNPSGVKKYFFPVNLDEHKIFSNKLKNIPAHKR
ncbi:MAG: DUF1272 domain-containing protein [Campylobacteraceae bacterium]|nr:DUF1272 domain-containing protein [Campylobacteraceae bacterium]